jgi:hypothetical protein
VIEQRTALRNITTKEVKNRTISGFTSTVSVSSIKQLIENITSRQNPLSLYTKAKVTALYEYVNKMEYQE